VRFDADRIRRIATRRSHRTRWKRLRRFSPWRKPEYTTRHSLVSSRTTAVRSSGLSSIHLSSSEFSSRELTVSNNFVAFSQQTKKTFIDWPIGVINKSRAVPVPIYCNYYNYKKLSYRRDSAHLTSLYRTVQNEFRYDEPFRRGSRIWQTNRQTDGRADKLNHSV